MVVLTRQVSVSHSPPAVLSKMAAWSALLELAAWEPLLEVAAREEATGGGAAGGAARTDALPGATLRPSKKLAKAVLHEREVLGLIADVFPHLG